MDAIKILKDIVSVRQDLRRIQADLAHQERILDERIHDLIEFLKHKGIVETRDS